MTTPLWKRWLYRFINTKLGKFILRLLPVYVYNLNPEYEYKERRKRIIFWFIIGMLIWSWVFNRRGFWISVGVITFIWVLRIIGFWALSINPKQKVRK